MKHSLTLVALFRAFQAPFNPASTWSQRWQPGFCEYVCRTVKTGHVRGTRCSGVLSGVSVLLFSMSRTVHLTSPKVWPLSAMLAVAALAAPCAAQTTGPSAAKSAAPAPFVIAPMIEGQGYCKAGLVEPKLGLAIARCARRNDSGVKELAAALNALEPGGAKGAVQVGYTIGINLLEHPKEGAFNPFGFLTQALHTLDRPAVIYLFANHFAGSHAQPPIQADSLARFADQSVPTEKYFQRSITPISLGLQAPISANQQRKSALDKVGKWYASLPPASRNKIVAFTLAGELHHFYDDFSSGMGRFDNIRITDYSPASVQAFQGWLRQRYRDVSAMNRVLGANFKDFSQVQPPSKNIHSDRLGHFSEHFDSYAHGVLPIEGWLERLAPGQQIRVYLNGVALGTAEYGLNRQDVYEALPDIRTAQLGFRYRLDFSRLPRGKHTLQVMLEGPNQRHELAQRSLSIMGSSQAPIDELGKTIPAAAVPKKVKFYLDRPSQNMAVFYNPLARDWLDFRSAQVTQAYDEWFDASVIAGLPAQRLFTHQIAVATVGGWNPVLFASDASLMGRQRYKKGINLYGGSASTALLRRHYLEPGETFGVPEFHTQAWKNKTAPVKVLRNLQQGGASFVSPYFLSMAPEKYRDQPNAHDKFRLSPHNKAYGSDHLYRAIADIAKK